MEIYQRFMLYGLALFSTGIVLGVNIALQDSRITGTCVIVVSFLLASILFHVALLNPANTHTIYSALVQYLFIHLIWLIGWYMKRKLLRASKDSTQFQAKLLMDILSFLSDTKYGRDHAFGSIKSVDDFRTRHPLTRYEHYLSYVEDIIQNGSPDILFPGHSDFISTTTGTITGRSKAFPVVVRWKQRLLRTSFIIGLVGLFSSRKNFQLQKFHFLRIQPRITTTHLNLKKGALSGLACPLNVPFIVVPFHLNTVPSMDYGLYINILFGIKERYVGFMLLAFPALAMAFFKKLETEWDQFCDDLDIGLVSADLDISDEIRNKLNLVLNGPDPERAADLRMICRGGFQDIVTRIWPNCSAVWMMCSGACSLQATVIKERYIGTASLVDLGHGGTEGVYGWNLNPFQYPPVFTLSGIVNFFEFIHSDDISSEQPTTVLPHEVKIGEEYEIVITTHDGLCRYRTQDVAKIKGFCGGFPEYEFTRRTSDELNLLTEKLPEILISKSLCKVLRDWPNLQLVDYTCTENCNVEFLTGNFSGKLFYVIFLEADGKCHTKNLATEVDSYLCDAVEYYATFRQKGTIHCMSIVEVKRGTFHALEELLMDSNSDASHIQYKTPRVTRTEAHLRLLSDNTI